MSDKGAADFLMSLPGHYPDPGRVDFILLMAHDAAIRAQAIEECAKLFDVPEGCWMCEQDKHRPGAYEMFRDGLGRDCHEHENDWCVCANWPGKMIRALLNPAPSTDIQAK